MPPSTDRRFAANLLGTMSQTIIDRQTLGMAAVAGAQPGRVLEQALSLEDAQCAALVATLEAMLESRTDDLLTSEFMCRMCDELACPDERCPVERAEPAPADRRGLGCGVG